MCQLKIKSHFQLNIVKTAWSVMKKSPPQVRVSVWEPSLFWQRLTFVSLRESLLSNESQKDALLFQKAIHTRLCFKQKNACCDGLKSSSRNSKWNEGKRVERAERFGCTLTGGKCFKSISAAEVWGHHTPIKTVSESCQSLFSLKHPWQLSFCIT